MSYASLAMYPFEPLRPLWEQLWRATHERAPWTPASLRWSGDVHEHWLDAECRVAQACGWPVATSLRGHVEVVGAFSLALDGGSGHRYRSVVMSNRPVELSELVDARTVAAVNGPDSLSGWISLLAAAGQDAAWPGPVRWTGGHLASMRALRAGDADVASIDALTLALARRHDPELLSGLHEVARGPLVPSLPVVVRAGTEPQRIAELGQAFADALGSPDLSQVRAQLLVEGFVALARDVYEALLVLAPRANVGTFVPAIPDDRHER